MNLSAPVWILRKPSQSSFLIKLVQSESTIRNGMNQVLRAPRLQTSLRQLNTSFQYCSSVLLKIYQNVLTFLLAANTDVYREKPPPFLREIYTPSRKPRIYDCIYISRLWCFTVFVDCFYRDDNLSVRISELWSCIFLSFPLTSKEPRGWSFPVYSEKFSL